MAECFTLSPFEAFVLPTRTRFPFRYGIASMTDVPQLFLRTRMTIGASSEPGVTAEGLPPKWFTKDPATSFEQDLPEMLAAIGHATRCAESIAGQPVTFFDLWRELNRQQNQWARARQMPPLLAHLGVSLVERAVLDARCRLAGQPLHRMLASGQLGIRLGEVYDELGTARLEDLLPAAPLDTCFVRHTVGLGDALAPGDIAEGERADDGLPQDLQSCIRAYGLRYFKVKLRGDFTSDGPRLREVQRLLARETGGDYRLTIDGNENFTDFDAFRQFWDLAVADGSLTELWRRIIIVEQPVHRDRALSDHARHALQAWPERPALIIDESDGAIGDVPQALDLGYAGASFKSCKGIVKGLANACLVAARRRQGRPGVLTGEDLCTLGPIALSQDLAMMALLGIDHVERNGHHYYRGLSMFPREWQAATLADHGDLYARHPDDFPCVRIQDGALRLGSVNAAPLGVQPRFDPSEFAPEPLPV